MNLESVFELIRKRWEELNRCENMKFDGYVKTDTWSPIRGKLEHPGVYVIYEGDGPIYVDLLEKENMF